MIQFLRFCVVGACLFVFDAAVFSGLLWLGLGQVPARLVAIALAVFVSWLANRSWTFGAQRASVRPGAREFAAFAATQALGAAVNAGVSLAAYQVAWIASAGPWAAVAAGSIAALAVNFAGAKFLVFRRRDH